MEYFVDILSGTTKQGSGPLTAITDWTVTKRIDRAGSFSFTMPAEADAAGIVQAKRSCKIYARVGNAYQYVGGGVIDSITHVVNTDGTVALRVAGDDELRELTYRTVGALALSDTDVSYSWAQRGTAGSVTAIRHMCTTQNGTIVAVTNDGHAYTSTDSGATWTDRGQLGSDTDTVFAWDGSYYSFFVWYVNTYAITTAGNTYRSGDNGITWSLHTSWAADSPFVRSRVSGTDYWIAIVGANVYRSANYFTTLASWTNIGALGSETSAPSLVRVSDSVQVAGTAPNAKIFRTTDGGVTWSDLGRLGSETSIPAMGVNGTTVIAGTSPNGKIYRSTDSGATWSLAASLASSTIVSSLLYLGGNVWLAGTGANGKIYRSADDGVNWSEIGDLTEAQITALINKDTFLASGSSSNKVYASTTIYTDTPTPHADAVAELATLAPAGWTFSADGTPDNDEIFMQFAGESVLEAALLLAERSETHCWLSASKTLTYTDTWTSSGVHLVELDNAAAPDSTVGAIVTLNKTADAYSVVSRVYPYGRDVNDERLGISASTATASTGFTIDKSNNYVQHTDAYTNYGLIEQWIMYDDIKAESTDNSIAANALVKAASAQLNRYSAPLVNYNITLAGLSILLTPMQTVAVSWRGAGLTVDETLKIIEATWAGDANGMTTASIVASTDPYWIEDDAETIGKTLARVPRLAAR